MRGAAIDFDRRLRDGLDDDDIARLQSLLGRLHDNIAGRRQPARASPPPSPVA